MKLVKCTESAARRGIIHRGWKQLCAQELLNAITGTMSLVTMAELEVQRMESVCMDDEERTRSGSGVGTAFVWGMPDLHYKSEVL